MKKPVLLWVDCNLSVQHGEPPAPFADYFQMEYAVGTAGLESGRPLRCEAVCFDFDYPDRAGLRLIQRVKENNPSVPVMMLTLQHSEALAIWAFRVRVWDYLVKPISRTDLHRCLRLLSRVSAYRERQEPRSLQAPVEPIPDEIPITRLGRTETELLPAIYFVEQHFNAKIAAPEVARLCNMSPFRFSRKFHDHFGITFQDYLLRFRIGQACRLLQNPHAAVSDVAYAVGFNDGSHFTRQFKKHVGVPPSEFAGSSAATDPMSSLLTLPQTGASR